MFSRTDWDHNGRAHYEKAMTQDEVTLAMVRFYPPPLLPSLSLLFVFG